MMKKITHTKYFNGKRKGLMLSLFFCLSLCFALVGHAEAREINPDNVIGLVNQSRLLNGMDILKKNEILSKAAIDKMNDMFSSNYFSHTSPKGTTPWHWIEKNGYDYKYAGENLAVDFQSAERQHKAWMESATHRKNILNPNYQEIGIAVGEGKIDGKQTILTVQFFGTKIDAPATSNKPGSYQPVSSEQPAETTPIQIENPLPERKIESLTLPKEDQNITVQQGYGLINHNQLIRSFSWLTIILVFVLSIFVNIAIVKEANSLKIFQTTR